jgi:hypothetical protein
MLAMPDVMRETRLLTEEEVVALLEADEVV